MKRPEGHSIDVIVPVYNGEQTIAETVWRILELSAAAGTAISVIVCNDGSTDATGKCLTSIDNPRLHRVELTCNGGRANACNQGAAAARAEFLLFLDADCQPAHADFFVSLNECLEQGADLVYGPIAGRATGFWSRYLQQVERKRREYAMNQDHLLAMTSGNLLVRRELFSRLGGFSDAYRHYGFEDKDLIARLLAMRPRVMFEPRACVLHDAGNTVAGYCRKMQEVGCHSAPIFARRQPEVYKRMAYSRLDPDLALPPMRGILRGIGRYGADPLVRFASWAVDQSRLPWSVQALLLKSAAALSYLRGAAQRPSP